MSGVIESEPFAPRYSCTVNDIPSQGLRLDRYAAENLKLLTRSQIKTRKLQARLNGREVKISRLLKGGEKLELFWEDAQLPDLIPENIPLDIIFENGQVTVVNKAQGMVVHPGAGNSRGTLANALYYRWLEQKNFSHLNAEGLRPGIVHRLDKDTSGIIITARDEKTALFLVDQFKNRSVKKTYAAVVKGCPGEGRIDVPIARDKYNRKLFCANTGGKPSLTVFKTIKSWGSYSLLLLRLKTGRTHQIRVHLRYLGYPVLGDPLYGKTDTGFPKQTLMLHAKRLAIKLPDNEMHTFRTVFPDRFTDLFKILNLKK